MKAFETLAPKGLRALVALALAGFAAQPGAATDLHLSLQDAVSRALSDGLAARTAALQVETARARVLEARSVLLPQVSGQVQEANEVINLKTFGFDPPGVPPIVGPFNVFDAHLTVAMNVIDLAALRRLEAARAGVQASTAERRRTDDDVAAAVATLYVELGRSEARITEIEADVALFGKLRDLAADQRRNGVGTKLDTTRAEVQLQRQRQALLVAGNQRDSARLALLRAIGADLGDGIVLSDDWAHAGAEPSPALDRALAAARRDRPELAALTERRRAAELALRATRAERLPTIQAQAQGGRNGNYLGDLSWVRSIGAVLAVPIYTGRAVEARAAQAQIQIDQLALEQKETERQVEQEVRQALLAYDSARGRVELATQNLQLADEELELARDRFQNGVASSIEVDNAQTSLAAAHDTNLEALADQSRAHFDLLRATGGIRALIPSPEPDRGSAAPTRRPGEAP